MEWLELVNMEYGECIVLGGRDRSILMVDCGSVSQKLREGDVPLEAWVETLADRYDFAMDRFFLLTHYHRDHLWGFQKLLESRPEYFTRVYLPRTPLDRNGSPQLLEFALFAYLFLPPQSDSFQVNTWCVRAFQALEKHLGADRIFTVGAGDRFHFDGVDYQVLWPRVEDYPFDPALGAALEELNVLFSSPFQPESFQRFMALKEEFLTVYRRCGEAFSVSGRELPDKRRAFVEHLNRLLGDLEDLREDLNLSSQAHDAREICKSSVRRSLLRRGKQRLCGFPQPAQGVPQRAGPAPDRRRHPGNLGGNRRSTVRRVLHPQGASPRHRQRLQQPVRRYERRAYSHQQRGVSRGRRHCTGLH